MRHVSTRSTQVSNEFKNRSAPGRKASVAWGKTGASDHDSTLDSPERFGLSSQNVHRASNIKAAKIVMSAEMTDCPFCERRVLTSNGICPSCNNDLSNEAVLQRQILKRKATTIADTARAGGASFGEIESELKKSGVEEDLIKEIMMHVEKKTPEGIAQKNELDMRHGTYWLLGGIAITVVSYLIARSSKNGGVYIIAYGAIIAGGIQFVRAYLKSRGRS